MSGDFDPVHWGDFRQAAHDLLDAAVDRLEMAGEGRVWTPVAETVRGMLSSDMPLIGIGPSAVGTQLAEMLPYGVGNTHPRFFGWVHGSGSPGGLLSEIASAAMNVNAGGPDHLSPLVEKQVLAWSASMIGMPHETSGLVLPGCSIATLVALKVARDAACKTAPELGVRQARMVGYTSDQAHGSVVRAFDFLGLGRGHLRSIPSTNAFEFDLDALRVAIAADKAAGLRPFALIGTAGTVNTGAIDDLGGLAKIAKTESLWLHIDAAFGAAGLLGTRIRDKLAPMAAADSVAFDFHKWFGVNYEAAAVLIRDQEAHFAAFSDRPDYQRGGDDSFGGGAFWAADFGPELSRGFRALKVWSHISEHGTEKIGQSVDRNINLATYLCEMVKATETLELLAPQAMQICCFRYVTNGVDLDALNQAIVSELQSSGVAVPSTTIVNGALAIRVNITNHRTQKADLDVLVEQVVSLGQRLSKTAGDANV